MHPILLLVFSIASSTLVLSQTASTGSDSFISNPVADQDASPEDTVKTEVKSPAPRPYRKSTAVSALNVIPTGDFGSTDISNGGFAKPGWGVSLESRNNLGHGFSFISYSTYSWINLDTDAMEKAFTSSLQARTTVTGGQHRPFLTTLGLGKTVFKQGNVQAGVSAMAGIMYNSFKAFQIKVFDDNNNVLFSDILKFDTDFEFTYLFGVDLNYYVIPEVLAIHLGGNYVTANLNTFLQSDHFEAIKVDGKMQMMNVNLGVIFNTN